MSAIELSIVIPVCNKWELTRRCLQSLADTQPGEDCEVIVVDNASSDATLSDCVPFGQALFGERFRLLRQESNRNFAGACNLGARAAKGDWLFLLNNDTIALPGWRAPLHEAFTADPLLGAVGPLLLYPSICGFPDRVQHLGIYFSPELQVGHLYEFFPAAHPLVLKARRLQAITAAALFLPRSLFEGLGGFHEAFVNGSEDIDLCLRLGREGYGLTINPHSRIYHLCGQSPGRYDHEAANGLLLKSRSLSLARPDFETLLKDDGYHLRFSPWLHVEPALSGARSYALGRRLKQDPDEACLRAAIADEPFWREGYTCLAEQAESLGDWDAALRIRLLSARICPGPEALLAVYRIARRIQPEQAQALGEQVKASLISPQDWAKKARQQRSLFRSVSADLRAQADEVLSKQQAFWKQTYEPFVAALQQEGLFPA